jgi:large repetitive protein
MSFTVSFSGPPGKATPVSPSGNVSTATPTYTWNAVSTATWYYLWVNDSSTSPKVLQWFTTVQAGCSSGTGTCSVTPSTSLAAGAGRWWVQTWNDAGYGPWSDALSFSITPGAPPGKATQVSPRGTISTTTPTYIWNPVSSATWYRLWVIDSSTSTRILTLYAAADVGCASGTGVCSFTPSTALALGIGEWWVQTRNDNGDGPWSDGMIFSVEAPPSSSPTLRHAYGSTTGAGGYIDGALKAVGSSR